MAGQSSMDGRGINADLETLAPELIAPQTDVRIFHKGAWKDLQRGLGDPADRFRPELSFGRDMTNEDDALTSDGEFAEYGQDA